MIVHEFASFFLLGGFSRTKTKTTAHCQKAVIAVNEAAKVWGINNWWLNSKEMLQILDNKINAGDLSKNARTRDEILYRQMLARKLTHLAARVAIARAAISSILSRGEKFENNFSKISKLEILKDIAFWNSKDIEIENFEKYWILKFKKYQNSKFRKKNKKFNF